MTVAIDQNNFRLLFSDKIPENPGWVLVANPVAIENGKGPLPAKVFYQESRLFLQFFGDAVCYPVEVYHGDVLFAPIEIPSMEQIADSGAVAPNTKMPPSFDAWLCTFQSQMHALKTLYVDFYRADSKVQELNQALVRKNQLLADKDRIIAELRQELRYGKA